MDGGYFHVPFWCLSSMSTSGMFTPMGDNRTTQEGTATDYVYHAEDNFKKWQSRKVGFHMYFTYLLQHSDTVHHTLAAVTIQSTALTHQFPHAPQWNYFKICFVLSVTIISCLLFILQRLVLATFSRFSSIRCTLWTHFASKKSKRKNMDYCQVEAYQARLEKQYFWKHKELSPSLFHFLGYKACVETSE